MACGLKMGFSDTEVNREQDVPTCEQCYIVPSEMCVDGTYICKECYEFFYDLLID